MSQQRMETFTKRVLTQLIRSWNAETQMTESQWREDVYKPLGMAINMIHELHGYSSDMSLETDDYSVFISGPHVRTNRWA